MSAINKLLWNFNTEDVANKLVYEINAALDITAPFKHIQLHNNYAPHLSEDTKQLMKQRDYLKNEAYKSKDPEAQKLYHKIRNKVVTIQ